MGLWRELKYKFRRYKRIYRLENKHKIPVSIIPIHEDLEMVFPVNEKPKVSIIIPFFNQKQYTWNCLKSIYEHLPKVHFEIILVDDSSTEKINFSKIHNIRHIKNETNLGFLRSVNKAIQQAEGEFIYLLNNDTIVKQGFLDELLFVFDNFDNVGAVGSMLINADGSLQEAGSVFMKDCRISQVVGQKKTYYPEFNYIYKVDYCSGCSLLFRKNDDNGNLNLFDEQFAPAYFEETDLCFRLKYIQGKDIYYTPFSKVIHFNGVSYDSNIQFTAKKQELFDKNLMLFRKKWHKEINAIQAEKQQTRILELNDNKSIVFYNGIIPEYDKNSGELRLAEIIKAYKKKNYFVAIVAPKNEMEWHSFYNEYFQRLGVCVYYEHQRTEDRLAFLKRLKLKKTKNISWFYAVKIFNKNYKTALAANPDTKLVFDMVDIHHLRYKRAMMLEPKRLSLKKDYYRFLKWEKSACRKAHITIAISDDEKSYMEKLVNTANIITISNIHYIKKKKEEVPGFSERKHLLFVGSIHPPNVDAIQFLIKDIMPLVWEKDESIQVDIVGNVCDIIEKLHQDKIHYHGYVPDMEKFLLDNRIMIAPLRYGAGVKGKIGQAFEYFLPVISTEIGAEGMKLEDRKNALIANNPVDFAHAILELYHQPELWEYLQGNSESSLYPFSKERLLKQIDKIEKIFYET